MPHTRIGVWLATLGLLWVSQASAQNAPPDPLAGSEALRQVSDYYRSQAPAPAASQPPDYSQSPQAPAYTPYDNPAGGTYSSGCASNCGTCQQCCDPCGDYCGNVCDPWYRSRTGTA